MEKSAAAEAQADYLKCLVTLEPIVLEGRTFLNPITGEDPDALLIVLYRYGSADCILCGLPDPDTECEHCEKWNWHSACSKGVELPCLRHCSSMWIRLLEMFRMISCQPCVWESVSNSDVYVSDLQYCKQVLKKTMGHV